jgi:hypothetical protein
MQLIRTHDHMQASFEKTIGAAELEAALKEAS